MERNTWGTIKFINRLGLYSYCEVALKYELIHSLNDSNFIYVSTLQFYSNRLSIREKFNSRINLKNLSCQFMVDVCARIEASRIDWLRHNQHELRTDSYKGVEDYMNSQANLNNLNTGKMYILPSSFTGSPRAIHQNYLDAMAMMQVHGKPDLLLTMTSNPEWKEIQENLLHYEKPIDRPDLIARVFSQMVKILIHELRNKRIFSKLLGFLNVVEFQKRGFPHVLVLIWLEESDKINDIDTIDDLISAEISDKNRNPILYELMKKLMIHGPCAVENINFPCMDRDTLTCQKSFPKDFILRTVIQSIEGVIMASK